MNPLKEPWFWLLIISVIGLIIAFILFETQSQVVEGRTVTPTWIWAIYLVAIGVLAIAFIVFCYRMHRHYQHKELLEACCGIVDPPKKKLQCPAPCPDPCEPPVETCIQPKVLEPAILVQPLEPPVRIISVEGTTSNLPYLTLDPINNEPNVPINNGMTRVAQQVVATRGRVY